MPVTIRDLAQKLNLSITTISRALDGYAEFLKRPASALFSPPRKPATNPATPPANCAAAHGAAPYVGFLTKVIPQTPAP